MAFESAAVGAGGSVIGSGLQFAGGLIANSQNASFNAANLANQQAQFEQQMNLAMANQQWNHDFQLNQTLYRVQDAIRAGVSPLVALGAPMFNPSAIGVSPGSVGGTGFDNPFAGAGAGLSMMGQDISRAAMAAQTEQTRQNTIIMAENMRNNSAVAQSEAERNMADAALARKKAELIGMPSQPHPNAAGIRFVDGQGNSPIDVTKLDPSKTISPSSGGGSIEAGITPATKPVVSMGGGIDPQPSLGTSVGATGETIGYTIRNRLNPPAGYHVGWDGNWYKNEGSSWWDRPLGYSRYDKESSWYRPDYSGVGRASQYGP